MVKLGRGSMPLLRRPFSVFEVLRTDGRVDGLTLLSKRIGVTTDMLFDAVEGDIVSCLGPLGRPFEPVIRPPKPGWWPAASVWRRLPRSPRRCARAEHAATLFYGARSGRELFYLDWFETRGVRLVLATEDGSVGDRGRVTVPLERELRVAGGLASGNDIMSTRAARSRCSRRWRTWPRNTAGRRRCRSNASWDAAWAAATAA